MTIRFLFKTIAYDVVRCAGATMFASGTLYARDMFFKEPSPALSRTEKATHAQPVDGVNPKKSP